LFRDWSEPGSYQDVPAQEPFSDSLATHLKLGYYASVSFINAQIGKLLNKLQELGLDENTIIVLWGDHGFKLGEFGQWSKHSTTELDTRVPLIIKVPGAKVKGASVDGIVDLVDLFPTLCDLAHIPLPEPSSDGTSFADLVLSYEGVGKKSAYSTIIHEGMQGHSLRSDQFRFSAWYAKYSINEPSAV